LGFIVVNVYFCRLLIIGNKIGMEFFDKVYSKVINLLDVLNLENLIYYLSVAPFMLLVELIIVGWDKSSLKKIVRFNKSVRTDFFFYLLDAFNLYNLITVILSFGVFNVLARLIYEFTNFNLISTIDNIYIQFIILFIFSDLKNYFSHYLFHRYNALWALHEFHHSATHFCMLTRHRGHFLETALKRIIDVIPFAIFGSLESYLVIKVLIDIHQLLLHSSIKSSWGFVGKYILVSPSAHRLHHSIERKHYGKNFGNTFIFWDRLFGTYVPHTEVKELGVEDSLYNKNGIFKDILLGFVHFFKYLKSDAKSIFQSK
jgi:sterol desaturase/sphingolipid hydroxylase (fatty acid hydroxylase superfamily)